MLGTTLDDILCVILVPVALVVHVFHEQLRVDLWDVVLSHTSRTPPPSSSLCTADHCDVRSLRLDHLSSNVSFVKRLYIASEHPYLLHS